MTSASALMTHMRQGELDDEIGLSGKMQDCGRDKAFIKTNKCGIEL